jgi:hypothetical protein
MENFAGGWTTTDKDPASVTKESLQYGPRLFDAIFLL